LAAAPEVRDRYEALASFLTTLGEEVRMKTVATYVAFRRLTNFVCVEVQPQLRRVVVYAKVDPTGVNLEPGFTRDVRSIGHAGTGGLEIVVDSDDDLERAKPLLVRSYEAS
jgi:predicted transport protein